MKMKEIATLSKQMDMHPTTLFRKLKGLRGFTKQDVKRLEELTGIDRRAWLWPDEFPNPLLSSSESKEATNH